MINKKNATGILGGTFDPIHNGHLAIAQAALEAIPLETIEFIPCALPPHRNPPIASPIDRLEMVKCAIDRYAAFHVNTIEIDRGGISYTIDTITELRQKHPENRYFLILGTDAFSTFNQWREWKSLLTHTHLVVVSRSDKNPLSHAQWATPFLNNEDEHAGRIFIVDMKPIPISATEIRKKIHVGEISKDIPPAVSDYIKKHRLYKR